MNMPLEPSGALIDEVNACEPNWVCPPRMGRLMAEALDQTFRALGLNEKVDALWAPLGDVRWPQPEVAAEWAEQAQLQLSVWLAEHKVPELTLWVPSRVAQDWIQVHWEPRK